MVNTYCGKSCESCIQKEQMECQGCKLGPGRSLYDGCEIAMCCKSKGHETCDTCTSNRYCGKRSRQVNMPEYRRRKQAEEAEQKEAIARKAPFLGKWLWILFWLVIPSVIAGLLTNDTVVGWFPGLYLPGQVLRALCGVAYGLILFRMAPESERYRVAGILSLIVAAVNVVLSCLSPGGATPVWTLVLSLPAAVVGFVAEYQEYMGHGNVLQEIDSQLSGNWYSLWKWYIGMFGATIGSIILILIFPLLGLLVALAAMIGLVVVSILKLVYLYRSAMRFREYSC